MKKTVFSVTAAMMAATGMMAAGVAINMASPAPVFAQAAAKATVDAAKAAGVVGEQSDGYLGFVKSGDAATKAAVQEINDGRAKVYAEAAAKNNVPVAAAGAATFSSVIMPKLKAGEYYKNASGAWKQK